MSEPDKKTKDQIQDDRLNDHWSKIEALEKDVKRHQTRLEEHRREIDFNTKKNGDLEVEIAELRNQTQNNAIADLNHSESLKIWIDAFQEGANDDIGVIRNIKQEFQELQHYSFDVS